MRAGNSSYSPPTTPAPTPAPSAPAPSAPAPSTPAPSTPASSTPASSTPASSTPAPSTPAPSTPAPSAPIQFTSNPSTPIQFTPAPAPSAPAPSAPTPSAPAPSAPAPSAPAPSAPAPSAAAQSGQSDNISEPESSKKRSLDMLYEQQQQPDSETVKKGVEALQTLVREKIEQRSNITPDKLRQLLLEPIKGGAASDANHSDITGGVIKFPTTEAEIRDFPIQQNESRDEYRRKLETTLADELLSTDNAGYQQSLDLMSNTEGSLRHAIIMHPNRHTNEQAKALMSALYGENSYINLGANNQISQFTNGVNQAKAENNDLMVSATRTAGLLQAIGWLGAGNNHAGNVQEAKVGMAYSDHQFFGDGRGRVPAETKNDATIYKGIVKSENYTTVKDGHKNDDFLTKAQIANKPEVELGQKPDPNIDETNAPAWLKDDTARTMPFVNSVSGLGMISSMSDALGLLPDNSDEKIQILSLVAAAQLYSVGGHSFYEFMQGVSIGQDAKSWQAPEGLPPGDVSQAYRNDIQNGNLPHADHGLTYEGFVNGVSNEVLTRVAEAMKS